MKLARSILMNALPSACKVATPAQFRGCRDHPNPNRIAVVSKQQQTTTCCCKSPQAETGFDERQIFERCIPKVLR